ncbi:GNAT family N-acetyltransferase [Fulvivirga lutea]|uniref:GNAT family N-acetyltransferase n=1 Tax=Fulvivirga lutea TaxID=2810512 RepID=A0A974ZZG5_9BACT|nr:GNAT family N-acetyltransferase [Fulvivirga lutea]QSE96055.1 GNAT family N-acetyltransferase [Fulvivirga lutea]
MSLPACSAIPFLTTLAKKDLNLTFRKALTSDMGYLLKLREDTMNTHLAKAGFELSAENHRKGLEYEFENAQIILLDGKQIGMLKSREYVDYFEIIQIQITPELQGKGIGKQVVQTVISKAFSLGKNVQLSVLKNNPAQRLYNNLGFKIKDEYKHSFIMQVTMPD